LLGKVAKLIENAQVEEGEATSLLIGYQLRENRARGVSIWNRWKTRRSPLLLEHNQTEGTELCYTIQTDQMTRSHGLLIVQAFLADLCGDFDDTRSWLFMCVCVWLEVCQNSRLMRRCDDIEKIEVPMSRRHCWR
jgi:hypothetical protein